MIDILRVLRYITFIFKQSNIITILYQIILKSFRQWESLSINPFTFEFVSLNGRVTLAWWSLQRYSEASPSWKTQTQIFLRPKNHTLISFSVLENTDTGVSTSGKTQTQEVSPSWKTQTQTCLHMGKHRPQRFLRTGKHSPRGFFVLEKESQKSVRETPYLLKDFFFSIFSEVKWPRICSIYVFFLWVVKIWSQTLHCFYAVIFRWSITP